MPCLVLQAWAYVGHVHCTAGEKARTCAKPATPSQAQSKQQRGLPIPPAACSRWDSPSTSCSRAKQRSSAACSRALRSSTARCAFEADVGKRRVGGSTNCDAPDLPAAMRHARCTLQRLEQHLAERQPWPPTTPAAASPACLQARMSCRPARHPAAAPVRLQGRKPHKCNAIQYTSAANLSGLGG